MPILPIDASRTPAPGSTTPASADPAVSGSVTGLLQSWSEGDRSAMDRIIPLVVDELRQLALRHVNQQREGPILPRTALVHEVFLKLAQQDCPVHWQSRAQFFGWASTLMRHLLVDHARAHQGAHRGDGVPVENLAASVDLIAMERALQRLEVLDPQQGRVVEMRFFGGLDAQETAEALALSPDTVKSEWATGRAWMLREMQAGHA